MVETRSGYSNEGEAVVRGAVSPTAKPVNSESREKENDMQSDASQSDFDDLGRNDDTNSEKKKKKKKKKKAKKSKQHASQTSDGGSMSVETVSLQEDASSSQTNGAPVDLLAFLTPLLAENYRMSGSVVGIWTFMAQFQSAFEFAQDPIPKFLEILDAKSPTISLMELHSPFLNTLVSPHVISKMNKYSWVEVLRIVLLEYDEPSSKGLAGVLLENNGNYWQLPITSRLEILEHLVNRVCESRKFRRLIEQREETVPTQSTHAARLQMCLRLEPLGETKSGIQFFWFGGDQLFASYENAWFSVSGLEKMSDLCDFLVGPSERRLRTVLLELLEELGDELPARRKLRSTTKQTKVQRLSTEAELGHQCEACGVVVWFFNVLPDAFHERHCAKIAMGGETVAAKDEVSPLALEFVREKGMELLGLRCGLPDWCFTDLEEEVEWIDAIFAATTPADISECLAFLYASVSKYLFGSTWSHSKYRASVSAITTISQLELQFSIFVERGIRPMILPLCQMESGNRQWMMENWVKNSFIPQLGDLVAVLRDGYKAQLKEFQRPWDRNLSEGSVTFGVVKVVSFFDHPKRPFCKVDLREVSTSTHHSMEDFVQGKPFSVTIATIPRNGEGRHFPDFVVPKSLFDSASHLKWKRGDRFRTLVSYEDICSTGTVLHSEERANPWENLIVAWDDGSVESKISVWEIEGLPDTPVVVDRKQTSTSVSNMPPPVAGSRKARVSSEASDDDGSDDVPELPSPTDRVNAMSTAVVFVTKSMAFTKQEDANILAGVKANGTTMNGWLKTLAHFEFQSGRTALQIVHRYTYLSTDKNAPSHVHMKWSSEEVQQLQLGVAAHGSDWAAILKNFDFQEGRTPQQLKAKAYIDKTRPKSSKVGWSEEEKQNLIAGAAEFGVDTAACRRTLEKYSFHHSRAAAHLLRQIGHLKLAGRLS